MPDAKNAEKIEYKSFAFSDIETKQTEVNGVPVGVIKGMASTFGNVDLQQDVINFGAFAKTIQTHKARNGRPIRMLLGHDRFAGTIGGFPIDKVKEQKQGLKVEGHINLDVQRGQEAFALAKQGVLTDLSIGFMATAVDFERRSGKEIRVIKEIDLREISIVDEPANPKATITDVKADKKAEKKEQVPLLNTASLAMMGDINNSINKLLLQNGLAAMKRTAKTLSLLTKKKIR